MKLPRYTPRRWYWSIMVGGMIWFLVGSKATRYVFGGQTNEQRPMLQQVQGGAGGIVRLFLLPLATPVGWMQSQITQLAPRQTSLAGMSPAELQDRIRLLENENNLLQGQIQDYRNLLDQQKLLAQVAPSIEAKNLLWADVKFASMTVGSDTYVIDKGTSHGVREGQAVLKDQALVGRVSRADATTSVVTLISDPRLPMKIRAKLVHPTPDGQRPISDCIVTGRGLGTMRCDTVSTVQTFAPARGDLLLLSDPAWPRGIQNVVLGEVVEIERSENLFYSLKVLPRVDLRRAMSVVVLAPK